MMNKEDIAQSLGSDKVVSLKTKKLDGPLTYLQLIKEVNRRLVNRTGRPTDIRDTKYHNIPLTEEVWQGLKKRQG